jgi:ribosomal protein L37AE/L43A
MLTATRLSQFAHQLAEEARVRADYYKEQLRLLQARRADIETSLNASKLSQKRFAKFQAAVNGHFQCPRCWIEKATRSRLDSLPGTVGEDIFRCDECHFEVSTSAKVRSLRAKRQVPQK